ncbi:MAG: hypothetical protein KC550_04615 [Nanoarchaeota archaeon]|nr:hypothetical protein [Nanoarchaeota archaeon]
MVKKKPISINDPLALDKYKEKLNEIEKERERIRNYNKLALKENRELIPHKILHNLRNNSNNLKKKIQFLESRGSFENRSYNINGVLVVENYKICRLQFFFKESPYYKTIKELTKRDFEWDKEFKCWNIELTPKSLKYLDILRE